MKKRIVMAVMCLSLLSVAVFAQAAEVYVTEKGKKYHTQDCRWVKNRQTKAIEEKDALAQGYEPCGRCMKDKASDKVSKDAKKTNEQITKK